MSDVQNHPLAVFLLSLAVLWCSTWIGATWLRRQRVMQADEREDFGVVLAATLTLLGLIIGFSFAMAISRYDQRKNLEEGEANAIGTAYVRADLLPAADAAKLRSLLKNYVDQRLLFYITDDAKTIAEINARTVQLHKELWASVRAPAAAQPTPVVALVVSGVNDVLNSQGYVQAAWWNRIPLAAWLMMAAISISCCVLVGYVLRSAKAQVVLHMVLPLVVSMSFFLIADIDSPRGGVIRVNPQNLAALAESLTNP